MPTFRIDPGPDDDPGAVLAAKIDELEHKGFEVTGIVDLPQQLPRKAHWLLIAKKTRGQVERR